MNDSLYRGLIKDINVRFSYALTSSVVNTAVLKHNCDPVVAHILGRALTAGILTSPTLSEDERASITWQYPGPIKKIVVEFGSESDIRGTVSVKQLMNQIEVEAEIYGDTGSVSVLKSNTKAVTSSGNCEAPLMDVIDDLSYYFSISEQLETDMSITVGFNPDPSKPVSLCQGILLQAMPDCDFEVLERMRSKLKSDKFKKLLSASPEMDNQVEVLIKELLKDESTVPEYEIHSCPAPTFKCRCSKEKTLNILKTLNSKDVEEIKEAGENIKVACQFCSEIYSFTPSEVAKVVEEN